MAIIRWDPFREMIDIQNEMNRLFRDFFTEREGEREFPRRLWRPPLDIVETNDNFAIHIELPGFEKDEIDISIFDNVLTVKGERKVAPLGGGRNLSASRETLRSLRENSQAERRGESR